MVVFFDELLRRWRRRCFGECKYRVEIEFLSEVPVAFFEQLGKVLAGEKEVEEVEDEGEGAVGVLGSQL